MACESGNSQSSPSTGLIANEAVEILEPLPLEARSGRRLKLTAHSGRLIGSESVSGIGVKPLGNSVVGLAGDQVLAIAQADAARVYRDLSLYRIQLVLEDDGWHVDYELKSATLKGGGPHYVIDAQTGAVISKRYGQ